MSIRRNHKSTRSLGAGWLASVAVLGMSVGCNAEHADSTSEHETEFRRQIEKTFDEAMALRVANKSKAIKEDLDSLPSIIPVSKNEESVSGPERTSDQGTADSNSPETSVDSPETKAAVGQDEIVSEDHDAPGKSTSNAEVAKIEKSEVASEENGTSEPNAALVDSPKPTEDKTASETPEANDVGNESKQASIEATEQPVANDQAKSVPNSTTELNARVPRIERVLPKDGPSWLTAKPDYRNEVHTMVVNTSTSDSEEAGKNNLMDRAYAEFVDYASKQLGADVTAIKSINPKWVSTRLVKQEGDIYFSELDGNPVGWAKLSVDPATRDELMLLNQRAQWKPRSTQVASLMLSAIAVFGLAHVGLNAATAVFKKK